MCRSALRILGCVLLALGCSSQTTVESCPEIRVTADAACGDPDVGFYASGYRVSADGGPITTLETNSTERIGVTGRKTGLYANSDFSVTSFALADGLGELRYELGLPNVAVLAPGGEMEFSAVRLFADCLYRGGEPGVASYETLRDASGALVAFTADSLLSLRDGGFVAPVPLLHEVQLEWQRIGCPQNPTDGYERAEVVVRASDGASWTARTGEQVPVSIQNRPYCLRVGVVSVPPGSYCTSGHLSLVKESFIAKQTP